MSRSACRATWLCCLAVAVAPLWTSCRGTPTPTPLTFTDVAVGVRYATFDVAGHPRFGGHAFELDLRHVDVDIKPATDTSGRDLVDTIVAGLGDHLATNGSFFDPTGAAMGRVQRGARLDGRVNKNWSAIIIDDGVARIVPGDVLSADEAATTTPPPASTTRIVIQGLPRLVVGGEVQKLKPQSAERTAVCTRSDAPTRLWVIVSNEAETTEFARFLATAPRQGGLGCTHALNLDGGPSTQLSVQFGGFQAGVAGGWGVPNALVFTPRPASPMQR